MVMLVSLDGKLVMRIEVTVPSGSLLGVVLVNALAGTVALLLPPGLANVAVPLPAVGSCSIPKLALSTPVDVVVTLNMLLAVPSLPDPVPICSPELTQPVGRVAEERGVPAV